MMVMDEVIECIDDQDRLGAASQRDDTHELDPDFRVHIKRRSCARLAQWIFEIGVMKNQYTLAMF